MIYVAVSNHPHAVPTPESSTSAQPLRSQALLSDHRLAANRRNSLKSTGPRTWAGKYRSALNLQSRSLVPEALERELRARGEDPREFCRLQRDLAAIFHPRDATVSAAVTMLARAWWQKARRIRQWVGAGSPQSSELDAQIEALLILVVSQMRQSRRQWKRRLVDAVGNPAGNPAEVRRDIERQLPLFGGQAPKHRPQADSEGGKGPLETLQAYLEKELREILAEQAARRPKPAKPIDLKAAE